MSHHNSIEKYVPKIVSFREEAPQARSAGSDKPQLPIAGQGVVTFKVAEKSPSAYITFVGKQKNELTLSINGDDVIFTYKKVGETAKEVSFKNGTADDPVYITPPDKYTKGIDSDPNCVYWVSVDSLNKRLRYGKGEIRLNTRLVDYKYDTPLSLFDKDREPVYPLIGEVQEIKYSDTVDLLFALKDPVVIDPPAKIKPTSEFTMDEAALYDYVTPSSLSNECQILYGNVADFELNTPDFPDFAQALEYSVRTKGCLAYRIIEQKLKHGEFDDTQEYKQVYLRITLGVSQGSSPGIPYVLEIWPPCCGSPIHHHGFTHAVIKVLRGAIDVDLYRMLPQGDNSDLPLEHVTFNKGEVTYLMPQVNQFHRLQNNKDNPETCITIQSYAYSKDDLVHYATFDYIKDGVIDHFDPLSDYDFIAFKAEIKKEWNDFLKGQWWTKEPQK